MWCREVDIGVAEYRTIGSLCRDISTLADNTKDIKPIGFIDIV